MEKSNEILKFDIFPDFFLFEHQISLIERPLSKKYTISRILTGLRHLLNADLNDIGPGIVSLSI